MPTHTILINLFITIIVEIVYDVMKGTEYFVSLETIVVLKE
jgi:hypothetical protein